MERHPPGGLGVAVVKSAKGVEIAQRDQGDQIDVGERPEQVRLVRRDTCFAGSHPAS